MPKAKTRVRNFDKLVGERIRDIRLSRALSQTKLGEMIGVTFQQVQKYELGVNRVSASRLYIVSTVLGVPVDDLCQKPTKKGDGRPRPDISGVPQTRMTYELFRHALTLPADQRRVLLNMARSAAG